MHEFHVVFVNKEGRLQSYQTDDILLLVRFLIKAQPEQFELFFGTMCASLLNLYCAHAENPRENVDELKAVADLEELRSKAQEEARKKQEAEKAKEQEGGQEQGAQEAPETEPTDE